MANTEVGSAFVSIYPDTSKFQSQIERGLNTSMLGGIGEGAGVAVGGGFQKALSVGKVAVGNLIAGMASAAMGTVVSHLDDAARRVDILNSFPKTMQALGYEADVAEGSINEIMDHLLGLPTSTQDMAQFVQALAAANGDLDLATKAGLAFNDMLLTSGANTADAANAQQMLTKMIGTNTYSSQRWASIMATMPGPMKQLAEAMLGAGADGWALGEAIRDGTVSFEDMQRAMVELDQNGMNGLQSFEEQARSATGGIGTSFENLGNRINNALAKIMQAIGAENIVAPIEALSTGIVDMGGKIAEQIERIKENVDFTGLTEGLSALSEGFGQLLDSGIQAAGDQFIKFSEWIGDMADTLGKYDWSGWTDALDSLFNVAQNLASINWTATTEGLQSLADSLGPIAEHLGPVVSAVLDDINNSLSGINQVIGPVADGFGVELPEGMNTSFHALEAVAAVLDAIYVPMQNIRDMMSVLLPAAVQIMQGDLAGAAATLQQNGGKMRSAMDGIDSRWGNIFGNAASYAKNTFSKTEQWASNMSKSVHSSINNAGGTIKVNTPTITATLKSAAEGLAKVPQFSVMYHATGGVFNGPSVIGVAERGLEAAVPLEGRRMRPFAHAIAQEMGGTASNTYQINLNYDAGADVNQMARDLARNIKRYQLARG